MSRLKPWLTFLPKLGIALFIAWSGFAYEGPAQPLARAITTVLVAAIVARYFVGEERKFETPTELVIGFHARLLLKLPAYGAVAKVILEELDRLHSTRTDEWSKFSGAVVDALLPAKQNRFIFFGHPGTGDTITWSETHRGFGPDQLLIRDKLWHGVLKGKPEAEVEPTLVFELADMPVNGYRVYRMYLDARISLPTAFADPEILDSEPRKPEVLCYFPVALLAERTPKEKQSLAQLFNLRCLPNDIIDTYPDSFGDFRAVHSEIEGGGYDIYENDLFRIAVKRFTHEA